MIRYRSTIGVVVLAAAMAVGLRSAGQAPAPPQAGTTLYIQGGTLINVRTGALQPNTAVLIENGRITRVGGGGAAPAGATVINAAGKFILPGLWDSHAHTRDYDGDLNINHGVTSTMDMGNLMDWILALQEAREKEMWIGPRIFPQGMSIGGTLGPHQWNAKTVDEAIFGAKQNVAAGVSFLKVYQNATPEQVKAVAEVAHANGLNLTGHLAKTDAREAILAGIDGLAHGSGIPAATAPPEIAALIKAGRRPKGSAGADDLNPDGPMAYSYMDPAKFDDLIKLMREHDVRLEPNIVQVFHGIYPKWDQYQLETHRLAMRPELDYMREKYEMYVRMWDTDFTFKYPATGELLAKLRHGLEMQQLFAKKYALAGGKLFVGTDNYYHAMAGLAVWHEMELLADGGVPNLNIVQAATINPAEWVHRDKDLGTVEAGKLADVIIVGKNPLENISNIRTLETVIQHGKVQTLGYQADYRVLIPRPYLPVNSAMPLPHITAVQPVAVPVNTKDLIITIKGTNFNAANRVLWDDIDLHVVQFSPTELKAAVPVDLASRLGTWKIHMITGGRVHQPGDNYAEIMVTIGKRIEQRWNGQKMSAEW